VFDLNEFLLGVTRYSSATGWGATFLELPVAVIELPATNGDGSLTALLLCALAALVLATGFRALGKDWRDAANG